MDTNPNKYNFLILDKGAKKMQWRKDSFFNKWCCENWKSICSRMKLKPYLSPCKKLNSKLIKDPGIRPETLQIIEEKVGPNLQLVGLGADFLNRTPIAKDIKATPIDACNLDNHHSNLREMETYSSFNLHFSYY